MIMRFSTSSAKSLFAAICGVTKAIKKSAWREAIGRQIRVVKDGNVLDQRVQKIGLQFTGYLVASQDLEEANKGVPDFLKIVALTDEQWRCFSEGDKLVRAVLAPLIERVKEGTTSGLAGSCDPYVRVTTPAYHPDSVDLSGDLRDSIGELVTIFSAHPSLEIVRNILTGIGVTKDEPFIDLVLFIENVMEREPGRPTDQDIEMLKGAGKFDTPAHRNLIRVGVHLFSLRCALKVMSGLLFDTFFLDQLAVVSEDNCFSVSRSRDGLGLAASVELQPTGSLLVRGPGDLVLVKLPGEAAMNLDGPACVGDQKISFSQQTGLAARLELRMLDAWLNPYGGLL
jgi:hypothetical protein